MNVSSSPVFLGPSVRERTGWRTRLPAMLVALTLLAALDGAAAQEQVTAVWKERQLGFTYRGYAAVYPCSVLQHRIARVLNAVGARPDLQVTVTDCDVPINSATVPAGNGAAWPRNAGGSGAGYLPTVSVQDGAGWPPTAPEPGSSYYRRTEPRQEVDVRVRLSLPAEVTPEVMTELQADRRRRELITRVTGDPLPLFDDPIQFTVSRQIVTLSDETAGIEATDCELLDQMAESIFREIGVRVIRRSYTCDRGRRTRIEPTLEVEALVPVGLEVAAPEAPAPGDGQSTQPGSEGDGETGATTAPAQIAD